MVGWAPVDLVPGRASVSEPKVGKSEISPGLHGDRGASEHLQKVARVVSGWRVRLEAWRMYFGRSHGLYVMEALDPMCDGGDC